MRALHHYEQIGLLLPSERTATGHRRYGPDAAAHHHLVNVFGLTQERSPQGPTAASPTPRSSLATEPSGSIRKPMPTLASPENLGAATATMAVLVDDVDEHHQMVTSRGGDIVYAPVDQP